ncbi:hypothetical protein ABZ700_11630 [Streptomyces diastaticus]|uniref:hypothetical protein n=1 Tax=Streptomyces diastaticus TaxID=1956 RepID=UPI0033E93CAF
MANISSRSYRNIAGVKWYLTRNKKKRAENREYVAIGATNGALVSTFFAQMEKSHEKWGRSGQRVALERDKKGTIVRDENGVPVERKDRGGRPVFEGEYVQYYSLVQGFGNDELDPNDPEAWKECQRRGLALAKQLSQQAASSTLKNGVIVDKKNAEEAASDGHMALVVTEIGASGKLHNHIILDATNRFTGGQLNSAFMTHHRLAKTHDRVLAEIGVEQREDMAQLLAELEARQKNGEKEASLRKIASEVRERSTAIEDRQDLRYEQWLKENELAKYDRLSELPVEPFAVGELKRRIEAVFRDERSVSWDQMQAAAAELHLTVAKRGKDVSFGMMRQQADGSFAQPAKSDIRRGTTLGEEFTLERAEQAIEENGVARQQQDLQDEYEPEMRQLKTKTRADVKRIQQEQGLNDSPAVVNALANKYLVELTARGELETQLQQVRQANEVAARQRAAQELEQQQEPAPIEIDEPALDVQKPEVLKPAERELPYRSQMRDLSASSGPNREHVALRIERLTSLDEDYQERFVEGQKPDSEFEARVKQIGIGRKILDNPKYRDKFHPAVVEQLELREVAKQVGSRDFERYKALSGADLEDLEVASARLKNTRKQIADGEYELVAQRRELSPREQMRAEVERAEREQSREVDLPGR